MSIHLSSRVATPAAVAITLTITMSLEEWEEICDTIYDIRKESEIKMPWNLEELGRQILQVVVKTKKEALGYVTEKGDE